MDGISSTNTRKAKINKTPQVYLEKSFFPPPEDSPKMEYVFEVYLTQQFVYSGQIEIPELLLVWFSVEL